MKASRKVILPLLALGLALAGCGTIGSRIKEHADEFSQLDPGTQSKIKQGEVGVGFTQDMVYMALGAPDAKRQRVNRDGPTETWIYDTYYDGYDGAAFVGHHRWYRYDPLGRRYHVYWAPRTVNVHTTHRDEKIRVAFRDGKVVSVDQAMPS